MTILREICASVEKLSQHQLHLSLGLDLSLVDETAPPS